MANRNNQNVLQGMEEDDDCDIVSIIEAELEEYEQLCVLLCQYFVSYLCKEPRRTSNQKGHYWVQEMLASHGSRCYDMFRMEKHVFYRLCNKLGEHGLRNSKNIGVEEMVAMFLLTIGHGVGNRRIQEIFQHSSETVSRLLHTVLKACLKLAAEIIRPCDPEFRQCHPKIENDNRYFPYFKDVIGVIDGIHIKCVVSESGREVFIGRKGYPTQNVMAVCDWDMCFTFVLAGWEGSVHDARVFHSAILNPAMNFPVPPQGKYYLVDASYPTPIGYLGPYGCERNHLFEFMNREGFRNHNEAFNFYHSSLRYTIDRTFGIWKKKFKILQRMRKYSFDTQVRIVCATMAIHNFIRRNSQTDADFMQAENESTVDVGNSQDQEPPSIHYAWLSSIQMNHVRDTIRDQIVRDF